MCPEASGLSEMTTRSNKCTPNYNSVHIITTLFMKIMCQILWNCLELTGLCVCWIVVWCISKKLISKRQDGRCIINGRLARGFIITFSFPDSRLDAVWHVAASYRSDLE